MKYYGFYNLIFGLLFFATTACNKNNNKLENGIWRAVLKTESGKEIPFNFEVNEIDNKPLITIINGNEKLKVEEIIDKGDSLQIIMPLFDSEIHVKKQNNKLSGIWIKHLGDKKDVFMPFEAILGDNFRFTNTSSASVNNIAGRWETVFISEENDTTIAVGEFTQNGKKVLGTFLTTTGDYRFLEGEVIENKLSLSCFDGSHAFLFTADIKENQLENGRFYSGATYSENWSAVRNENAKLPDAYSLTFLKPEYKKLAFNFPDLTNKRISLEDENFKGKVVIVQIMGSWCPNCMDETAFLSDYYKENKNKGVEIIALAYERSSDFTKAAINVERLKKRFNAEYTFLIAGTNDKTKVNESLPMISKFLAFPTSIIIDRNGAINTIYTGFSGPGTGIHYEEFVKEFNSRMNKLIENK